MSKFPDLDETMKAVDDYYKERNIFQENFGFGEKPAIVVIDFAYGWTDDAYAGGSKRLHEPVLNTAKILAAGRDKGVPIVFTTSRFQQSQNDPLLKSAADDSPSFRQWDERACEIDERIKPEATEKIIYKENASAFFGTILASYLIQRKVDTVLITGCSTSACVRATATDAKAYRFKPVIISDCVGDRAEAAHLWTLFDIQARFSDVVSLDQALEYLTEL